MSIIRCLITMLHDTVKELAERACDHELLKRGLDVYEIDSDGLSCIEIYAACYKAERARLVRLMTVDYESFRGTMKKSEYCLLWLSRFSSGDARETSKVVHNCGSRNFDTFSDDQSYKGIGVPIPIARARVKIAAAKRVKSEVRGWRPNLDKYQYQGPWRVRN